MNDLDRFDDSVGNLQEISRVKARQVLDSRGNPTVEAEIWTRGGLLGVLWCLQGRPRAGMMLLN